MTSFMASSSWARVADNVANCHSYTPTHADPTTTYGTVNLRRAGQRPALPLDVRKEPR
jgi:hypothetical protein